MIISIDILFILLCSTCVDLGKLVNGDMIKQTNTPEMIKGEESNFCPK